MATRTVAIIDSKNKHKPIHAMIKVNLLFADEADNYLYNYRMDLTTLTIKASRLMYREDVIAMQNVVSSKRPFFLTGY